MRPWTLVIACVLGCSEQSSGPTIEAMVVEVKPVVETAKPRVVEEPRPTPPPLPPVKPEPVKVEPVKTPPRHVPPVKRPPPQHPASGTGSAGSGAPLPDLEQNPYLSK